MSLDPAAAGDAPTVTSVTLPTTPPVPVTPPVAPVAPSPVTGVTTASASNVQPGVNLETGVRTDDDADRAKRDAAVERLADAYDDSDQKERVRARFADKEGS